MSAAASESSNAPTGDESSSTAFSISSKFWEKKAAQITGDGPPPRTNSQRNLVPMLAKKDEEPTQLPSSSIPVEAVTSPKKERRKSASRDATPKIIRQPEKQPSEILNAPTLQPSDPKKESTRGVSPKKSRSSSPERAATSLIDTPPESQTLLTPSPPPLQIAETSSSLPTSQPNSPVQSRSNSDVSVNGPRVIKSRPETLAATQIPPREPTPPRKTSSSPSKRRMSDGRVISIRTSTDVPQQLKESDHTNSSSNLAIGRSNNQGSDPDWTIIPSPAPTQPLEVTFAPSTGNTDPFAAGSAKKQPKMVSQELHTLKKEFEKERNERLALQEIVTQHQKLIESLSSTIDRQSKLILSLQQTMEIFSRPQRIASHHDIESPERRHYNAINELAQKEAQEDAIVVAGASGVVDEQPRLKNILDSEIAVPGPRKSKSAANLTSKQGVASSQHSEEPPANSSSTQEKDTVMSKRAEKDMHKLVDSEKAMDESSSFTSVKKARRKSKSNKELTAMVNTSSSPSINTTHTHKKHKDSKELLKDSSTSSIDSSSPKPSKLYKSDKGYRSDRDGESIALSKKKSNRKSMVAHSIRDRDSSTPSPVPSSPEVMTVELSSIIPKKEKRKSRKGIKIDLSDVDSPPKHSSSPSMLSSDPVTATMSADEMEMPRPRRSKSTSEKKGKGMMIIDANSATISSKAMSTSVEIIPPSVKSKKSKEEKPRAIRRTLSESEIEVVDSEEKETDKVRTSHAVKPKRKSEKAKRRLSKRGNEQDTTPVSAAPVLKLKEVRLEEPSGSELDHSDMSQSFEALTTVPAHESSNELVTSPRDAKSPPNSARVSQQFRNSSKRELSEEREHSKRSEMRKIGDASPLRPRPTITPHNSGIMSDEAATPESGTTPTREGFYINTSQIIAGYDSITTPDSSKSGMTSSGRRSSRMIGVPLSNLSTPTHQHSPDNLPNPLSRIDMPRVQVIPTLSLDSTSTSTPREKLEQARDVREATMLSPTQNARITPDPPLTARTASVQYLSSIPSNDIGIPHILEQISKYLLVEGVSLVALFEKRVDHARLEGLKRKLDNIATSNSSLIASSIASALKGEDPYVVAGVLKRWFTDLPDSLLMTSKTRYWLEVTDIEDEEICISGLQTLYYSLDMHRRRILRFVVDFLNDFITASNGVTSIDDVATHIAPILVRTSSSTPSGSKDTHLAATNLGANLLSSSTDDSFSGSPSLHKRPSYRMDSDNAVDMSKTAVQLMRLLLTHSNDIIKNHDSQIEFSRRADFQYIVRSATLEKIIHLIIDQNYTEREFANIVWATCSYICLPTELLSKLISLYRKLNGSKRWEARLRIQVLMCVKTWIRHSKFSLSTNKEFRSMIKNFCSTAVDSLKDESGPELKILQSMTNNSYFERSDDTWIQWKLSRLNQCEPFTFDLPKYDAALVAGQLAWIHCKLLSLIDQSELTNVQTMDKDRSPNYIGVVQHINAVTSWVAYDILSRNSAQERVRTMSFYLELATQLLAYHDFLGCWAIRGAFDVHPVSRLNSTWEKLNRKDTSKHKKLSALFEPRLNFAVYRKAYDTALADTGHAIPILAFIPKDIIRFETDATYSEPGMVDMDRLRGIYFVMKSLTQCSPDSFAKVHPNLKLHEGIWDFFANLPVIQETTLDQLSYAAEPKLHIPQSARRIGSPSVDRG